MVIKPPRKEILRGGFSVVINNIKKTVRLLRDIVCFKYDFNKNISKNDKDVLTNKNNCYNIPSTGKIFQSY